MAPLFVVITAECIASENSDCNSKSNYHIQHFNPSLFHYDSDLHERGIQLILFTHSFPCYLIGLVAIYGTPVAVVGFPVANFTA